MRLRGDGLLDSFFGSNGLAVKSLAPSFDWNRYLGGMALPNVDVFNVTQPEFYKELDRQLSFFARRGKLIQGALTGFYSALVMFVATTVSIGGMALQ